jgi:N-acetylglutamate synthase-like GNAT family acetyltransferase
MGERQAGFTIRLAAPRDAEAVSALLAASYQHLMTGTYEPAVLSAALPIITRANPALLASGSYYCAVDGDGQIVGCGGWTRNAPGRTVTLGNEISDCGHLRHFATDPDWLRRGVGRAIADICFRDAARAGLLALECFSSLNAEPFYVSLGFERVEARDVVVGGAVAFPSVLMRRAVSFPPPTFDGLKGVTEVY